MEQSESLWDRIKSGLVKGLKTGLVMMSIYILVAVATTTIPGGFIFGTDAVAAALSALKFGAFGTTVSSLFGAANAALSPSSPTRVNKAHGYAHMRGAEITQASPAVLPIITPGIAAARAQEQTQDAAQEAPQQASHTWRNRVSGAQASQQERLSHAQRVDLSRQAQALNAQQLS